MVKINTRPGSHAGVCSLKIRANDVIYVPGNACRGSMMTVLPVCWHGEASEPCGQALLLLPFAFETVPCDVPEHVAEPFAVQNILHG